MASYDILTITPKAADKISLLLADAPKDTIALCISITKGGCTGFNYQVDYTAEIPKGAEVIRGDFGVVVVQPAAVLYLLGAQMDFEETSLHSKFNFSNPNESSRCGCGLSVAF